MKIEKFWYNHGYIPYEKGCGDVGYRLTQKLGDKYYEFVKVYDSDKHSVKLEQKFKEEALIALENAKKKINGKS